MGTSNAFYTFISKSAHSRAFYLYYIIWVFFQFILSVMIIFLLLPDNWIERIWNGVEESRIALAFVAVFMQQQVWQLVSQIGESARLTIKVQTLNILTAILHLSVISILHAFGLLTIERIYIVIMLEILIASIAAYFLLSVEYKNERFSFNDLIHKYWIYCMPLIPYMWLVMIMKFSDTWFLQRYGGAIEQGYYAISTQFATASLVVTTAIIRILWKEVSAQSNGKDTDKTFSYYDKASRILFVFSAFTACFFIPWVPDLIINLLGEEYTDGMIVMSLMFLYPIHQSLAQVNSTVYYSLSLTRQFVLINSAQIIVATLVMYSLLAPKEAFIPGLELGSFGLAIKMVGVQFLGVNFSMWWLARKLGWKYSILPQLSAIVSFLLISYLVHFITNDSYYLSVNFIIKVTVSGVLYLIMGVVLLRYFPASIGMSPGEFQKYIKMTGNLLSKPFKRI
jgi:O-antigen/teichoic acid export membrane protein